MNKITLTGRNTQSQIFIGECFSNIKKYLPQKNVFIISDQNLSIIYSDLFSEYSCFKTVPGESSKTLKYITKIYQWLVNNGANRSSFLLGVGGGVVCDITGFIASTFMRGVDFGFIATSLLAQVDASIGGKNGVNLNGLKNLIGTINQPKFVICDTAMLSTLPYEELKNGFAEIIKHALIADTKMFTELEGQTGQLLNRDTDFLNYLVTRSVEIKAEIVQADEDEKNLRRKLNLGHTWGHAVEKVTGLPHGKAVSIGLAFAASLSVFKGKLKIVEENRIRALLEKIGLPVATETDPVIIFNALLSDKKRENDFIHFVFMQGIGNVIIEPVLIKELKQFALK